MNTLNRDAGPAAVSVVDLDRHAAKQVSLALVFRSVLNGVYARSILVVLVYAILPGIPSFLLGGLGWLSPHGYINIECLVVGVVALFSPRIVTFLLLLVEGTASTLYLVCYTYQFSVQELLNSLRYIGRLPYPRLMLLTATFMLTVGIAFVVAYKCPRPDRRSRTKTIALFLFLISALPGYDTVKGHNPMLARDIASPGSRVSLSPLTTLAVRAISFKSVESMSRRQSHREWMNSASANAMAILTQTPASHPDVVLILVESWGVLQDPALSRDLTSPYRDARILQRYKVLQGTVPFDGLTVPGEARELCHSHIGFSLLDLPESETQACLPAYFHNLGYKDIAVHGYVGGMFGRDEWYRKIGFDQNWFHGELLGQHLPDCKGAFPGTCDTATASWIGNHLLRRNGTQPEFVYWVTLNSHLPVPADPDVAPSTRCDTKMELQGSRSLCSWFRIISALHGSVQQLALDVNRPTMFILVGDHAPPFHEPMVRSRFSATDVPYVILAPIDHEDSTP